MRQITSMKICNIPQNKCTQIVPDQGIGPIPISAGRFAFTHDYSSITCNGIIARIEFSGTFRSATAVDGSWTDRNFGPPPYVFCGTQSFTWNAGKQ